MTTSRPPFAQAPQLARDVACGNRASESEITHLLLHALRRKARTYCIPPIDLDDVVAEAVTITLMALRRGAVQQPESIVAYATGVMLRVNRSRFQKPANREQHVEPETWSLFVSDAPTPVDTLQAHDRVRIFQQAMATLRPRQLEILRRFYLLEQSKEQVCREMGLTETQFRLAKHRAKEILRQRVEELGILPRRNQTIH